MRRRPRRVPSGWPRRSGGDRSPPPLKLSVHMRPGVREFLNQNSMHHESAASHIRMSLNMKLNAIALTMIAASAQAAPLPECDLSGATGVQNFTTNHRLILQSEFVQKLTNISVRAAGNQTVAKGEPILVSDLEVVQKDVTLKALQPLKYSANFLAVSFSYRPATAQTALYRFRADNGEHYHVLMYNKDAVFVREDGTLCNRVVRHTPDTSSIVAYTYQTDPEDVKFTFGKQDQSWGSASVRIIFGGFTSGVMQFHEVWARDGRVLNTQTHQFDPFAKEVKVAGFSIHISSTTADSALVSIDAPDERPIRLDEARAFSRYLKK